MSTSRKLMDLLYLKSLVQAFISGAISEEDLRRQFLHLFSESKNTLPDETV